ncbi:hypothetical protein PTT_13792 [Pyrenophora teres f. teres 0-1]|uniref:Uncharacterized protein n=1 Tax=Pyrenophora teres f. teres (strain 0-1) TaxID=861557 RepID=E3RWU3_PYRTT|nr:hypothetical protein PTT_13792 [Pyrenophora teres f. teres 0-1]
MSGRSPGFLLRASGRMARAPGLRREVLEVLVVREDFRWKVCSLELRSPLLHRFDDGEEFFVVDFVVAFSCRVPGGEVRYRAEYAVVVVLGEDSAGGLVRGVYF